MGLFSKLKSVFSTSSKENEEIKFKFIESEIESKIIDKLSIATKEVNIAMAWLTSSNLISKLEELKGRGILIKLIVDDNESNKIDDLKRVSNKLYVIKVIKYANKKCMHNKYCIIDNNLVIDGSYNWSKNASDNEEHIIILEGKGVAKEYKKNFDRLIRQYGNV